MEISSCVAFNELDALEEMPIDRHFKLVGRNTSNHQMVSNIKSRDVVILPLVATSSRDTQ